ncbi:MAG TPA: hypothetical protein VFR99_06970 [Marmoricola sp.]|jgi:hypothetical protein|nr:hypothetical protein [Marmoricola sp.]
MFSKSSLIVGFAAGYVLGSRAGRERYEQIKAGATKVAQNPKVQAAADRAQDAVAEQASTVVDAAKEKVTSRP